MRMPVAGNPAANAPLMAAIVEASDHLIMVDTGFPGELELLETLEALHFYPEDFTEVLNTHVHVDHIGNNTAFKNARIIASRVDFHYMGKYYFDIVHVKNPVEVLQRYFPHSNTKRIDLAAKHSRRLAEQHWREELLGDIHRIEWIEDHPPVPPFVEFVRTPGHTPGHYAIVLHGEQRNMMLCGDAMPSRLFWRRQLYELTPRYDTTLFQHSKAKVDEFEGIILGGHDLPFDSETGNYLDQLPITI